MQAGRSSGSRLRHPDGTPVHRCEQVEQLQGHHFEPESKSRTRWLTWAQPADRAARRIVEQLREAGDVVQRPLKDSDLWDLASGYAKFKTAARTSASSRSSAGFGLGKPRRFPGEGLEGGPPRVPAAAGRAF